MKTTKHNMDSPELRALDILRDEEYIKDVQIYEERSQMRTIIKGTFGKFDEEMRFEAAFDDQKFFELNRQGNYDDLIISDIIDRVRGAVYNECEKTVGELKEVPLEITEVGGYKLTCYGCGNEAKIPTHSLKQHNVSREEAFLACLARLHPQPPDTFMPCRNIYIP